MPVFRLLRRVKRKVSQGLRHLNEEASHPGYPPPHRASDNPFFVQPEDRAPSPPQQPEEPETVAGNLREEGEVPWYLKGDEDVEGWDSTDPSPDDPSKE